MNSRADKEKQGLALLNALSEVAAIAAPQLAIPFSVLNATLEGALSNMHVRRTKVLFDELGSGIRGLTEELIKSEPFLHRFITTYEAVLRTESEEKIRLFARLLSAAARGEPGTDLSDNFDQFQSILIDLSVREIVTLLALAKLEATTQAQGHVPDRPDDLYAEAVVSINGVPRDEVWPIIDRLSRTGLCRSALVGVVVRNDAPMYLLTPLYYRFAEWVRLNTVKVVNRH